MVKSCTDFVYFASEEFIQMLVSVHMPKCGGSSFRDLLKVYFRSKLLEDYSDFPLNDDPQRRNIIAKELASKLSASKGSELFSKYECIHGHFILDKYNFLIKESSVETCTWLRDPVERLGSHYYYWKRAYNPKTSASLHKRVVEEDWSLQKFCFSEELQNVYSVMLGNHQSNSIDFIGIVEHYDSDIQFFANRYLGLTSVRAPKANVNSNQKSRYFEDEGMIKEIREFHASDVLLYNNAIDKREERMRNFEPRPRKLKDTFFNLKLDLYQKGLRF